MSEPRELGPTIPPSEARLPKAFENSPPQLLSPVCVHCIPAAVRGGARTLRLLGPCCLRAAELAPPRVTC